LSNLIQLNKPLTSKNSDLRLGKDIGQSLTLNQKVLVFDELLQFETTGIQRQWCQKSHPIWASDPGHM